MFLENEECRGETAEEVQLKDVNNFAWVCKVNFWEQELKFKVFFVLFSLLSHFVNSSYDTFRLCTHLHIYRDIIGYLLVVKTIILFPSQAYNHSEKNPEKLGINGKNFCVLCVLNLFFW